MNKEQIYDEQIAPLMTQIIEICQKHGIAMLASYAIPAPEDPGLMCTTHLADGDGVMPFAGAHGFIRRYGSPPPLMLTTRDTEGKVTNMTAVIG